MHLEASTGSETQGVPATPGWRYAVGAGIFGWVLDAFDFFVVVFLMSGFMTKFGVSKGAIVWALTATWQ
jgi:SHS family lactate transporter-like MFS transporter